MEQVLVQELEPVPVQVQELVQELVPVKSFLIHRPCHPLNHLIHQE